MTHRLRAVAFDVDAASLISLREALPEWEIEVVNGATVASLTHDRNPGADLLVVMARAGVTETVGQGGLVWEEPDVGLLAESIHQLTTDPAARAALTAAGWQRYREQFSNERIEGRFLQALDGIL